jgi:hypothetical protein
VFGITTDSSTITLGNGAGDKVTGGAGAFFFVPADTPASTITFLGDGAGDKVDMAGNVPTIINLGDGAGDTVTIYCNFGGTIPLPITISTITVGDGDNDKVTVTSQQSFRGAPDVNAIINVGDGNHDVVDATTTLGSNIKIGSGSDTIHVGTSSTVSVGTGHTGQDTFIFDQQTSGVSIGQVTINGFHPTTDVIGFSKPGFLTNYQLNDDGSGGTLVSFPTLMPPNPSTIDLVGVPVADVGSGNFFQVV